MALLIFASVTPPAWDKVNFLDATAGGTRQVYGVFVSAVLYSHLFSSRSSSSRSSVVQYSGGEGGVIRWDGRWAMGDG